MSVFTALRRRTPELTVTGTGPYRLYDNGGHTEEYRFESLREAMAAAGTTDPDDWHNSTGFNRIYSRYQALGKVGCQQKVIEAPGLDTEFLTLQTRQQRQKSIAGGVRKLDEIADRLREEAKREEERKATRDRWEAIDAAAKAKKVTEEAAKPKHVIRYLTSAGVALGNEDLAVEVVTRPGYINSADHTETVATCKGCAATHTVEWRQDKWNYSTSSYREEFDKGGKYSTPEVREWAQEHAKACTAMPVNG